MLTADRLSVVLEQVFLRDHAGRYGSVSTFDDRFWTRYLNVFDRVRIVARVQRVAALPQGAAVLSDARVSVAEIPYYRGPVQFLRRSPAVRRALAEAARDRGAWLLRLPGVLGMGIARHLAAADRPFGVELVGDPQEIFQPGVTGSALTRAPLRWLFVSRTRAACARASAVAYVSRHVLPDRYPARAGAVLEHYSSINLPAERFAARARTYDAPPRPLRLLTVGSLAYSVKGVDVLLTAGARLVERGLDLRLEVVGDGVLRPELEDLSRTLGLEDKVTFLGHRPHEEIFARMDACDLFVLPSRSEGLPRVVVEAMARGAPCVATAVGGIPELLPPEWMAPPSDPSALADLIAAAAASGETLSALSARNLDHARDYEAGGLAARRTRLYAAVRAASEAA